MTRTMATEQTTNRFNCLRALLLAAALALLLIPLTASRASASPGVHHFCQPFATSDKSKWVPPNSYCLKAAPGFHPQLYGDFGFVDATSTAVGQRFCAILDVYSNVTYGFVKRFKSCSTSGYYPPRAQLTSPYTNFFAYSTWAYVYNGSSKPQLLGGAAAGNSIP
jgi:hypothetical protein